MTGVRVNRLFRLAVLLALLPTGIALAESEQDRQAREDLEKQLKSMVGTPPTKIQVDFIGLDQPNYELMEASFKLDGRTLPVSDLRKLNSDGEHLIFHGDVQPGDHKLESKFEFMNKTSQVVSVEGGYKWKVGSDVSFRTESGIEVRVKVTPELNPNGDIKNRITIKSPATVKMLAKLDDGTMPDPLVRPKLVVGEGEADAGVVVVKGESAAEKAAAKAEAKKKAREEALAAKKAAADEKKRKADEAKAARLAAAADKKQVAADAKAAKLAAAEEKKRAAAEALAAKNNKVAANDPKPVESSGDKKPAEVDAGAIAVAPAVEVDAGAAVVAVVPPAPVKVVEAAPVEESGMPMPLIIGIGVAVLGLLLFLIARRKKDQPR